MKRSPDLLRLADTVLLPGFTGTTAPDWVRRRLAGGLAGVVLFSRNVDTPAQLAALTSALRAENPEILIGIDEEAGEVTRLEARTGSSRPGNYALGVVDDVDLTERVARGIGRDLRAVGVNIDFAPAADVNSNPDNPVIGLRSFGADPLLVARHTAAWIRGLQSTGVAACAKHFPGHGDTSVDSHHGVPRVTVSREELAEVELWPFRVAIDEGVRSIMTGHLLVTAYDEELPATLSPASSPACCARSWVSRASSSPTESRWPPCRAGTAWAARARWRSRPGPTPSAWAGRTPTRRPTSTSAPPSRTR